MEENLLTPFNVNPIAPSNDGWIFTFKNNGQTISDNVLSTDVSTLNIESDRNVRLMEIFQKDLDKLVTELEGKINSEKTRKEISEKVKELLDKILSEQESDKDVALSYGQPKRLPRKTKKGGKSKKNTKWRREYLRVMRHYPTFIFKNAKFVPSCDDINYEIEDSLCVSMQIESDSIETVFKS